MVPGPMPSAARRDPVAAAAAAARRASARTSSSPVSSHPQSERRAPARRSIASARSGRGAPPSRMIRWDAPAIVAHAADDRVERPDRARELVDVSARPTAPWRDPHRRPRRLHGLDEHPLVGPAGPRRVGRLHAIVPERRRRFGEAPVERREDRSHTCADRLDGIDREEHDGDEHGDGGSDQGVLESFRGEAARPPVDADEERGRDSRLDDDQRLAREEQRDAHRDEDDDGHLDPTAVEHANEQVADPDADCDAEHEQHGGAPAAARGEPHRHDRDDRRKDGLWVVEQPNAELPREPRPDCGLERRPQQGPHALRPRACPGSRALEMTILRHAPFVSRESPVRVAQRCPKWCARGSAETTSFVSATRRASAERLSSSRTRMFRFRSTRS